MNKYLDYDKDSDCFTWGGTPKELVNFVNSVLEIDEANDIGELKEDKKHNAVSYKWKDYSIRLYTTTGNLMLFGLKQSLLLEKLHEINELNKNINQQPRPSSSISKCSDSEYEGSLVDHEVVPPTDNNKSFGEPAKENSIPTIDICNESTEINPESDYSAILKELALVKAEVREIKSKCFPQATNSEVQDIDSFEKLSNDLLFCRMENKDLKTKIRIQDEYVKRLEEEKASLVTTINLIIRDKSTLVTKALNADTSETGGKNNDEEKNSTKSNMSKRKRNKKKQNLTEKPNQQAELPSTDEHRINDVFADKSNEAANQNQQPGAGISDKRKTTVIIGDSMVSRIQGWKMTDKSNKITVKSFPGATTDDMSDYIKPSLKYRPDNIILHIGTNNLRSNSPNQIAEEIVKLCEFIESESPMTKVAVSLLTTRQDSLELERKRLEVNKILCSFIKTRDWKLITHSNIDANCLNGRKIHLNAHGTILMAKNFKDYIVN